MKHPFKFPVPLVALASAIAISGGGCALLSTAQQAQVTATVAGVQQSAVQACGFLPTAASVAAIIASLVPGGSVVVATADSIAAQICAVVSPAKASGRLGASVPTVNGVPVHGTFVRR